MAETEKKEEEIEQNPASEEACVEDASLCSLMTYTSSHVSSAEYYHHNKYVITTDIPIIPNEFLIIRMEKGDLEEHYSFSDKAMIHDTYKIPEERMKVLSNLVGLNLEGNELTIMITKDTFDQSLEKYQTFLRLVIEDIREKKF